MTPLLLVGAALLAGQPAAEDVPPAAQAVQVVVLDLETVDVPEGQATLIDGIIADAMQDYPELQVVTAADIRSMADFEADKQLVGCDQNSCLAEIAGAMGAQYVVFGRVGYLGDELVVQLNLFDAGAAKPVGREDLREASVKDVADRLPWTVGKLVAPLTGREPPPEPPRAEPSPLPDVLLWTGAGVAGLGALAALGGGVGAGVAWWLVASPETKAADKNAAQPVGAGLVVVSGLGVVTAVVGGALLGASFVVGE